MSDKSIWMDKFANWPSIVLLLLGWGGVLLSFPVMMILLLKSDISARGFMCAGLSLGIGILFIKFSTVIGSFIYEFNRRQSTWLWKKVLHYKDETINKAFSSFPYECSCTILIVRIVGIWIILITVMFFIFRLL